MKLSKSALTMACRRRSVVYVPLKPVKVFAEVGAGEELTFIKADSENRLKMEKRRVALGEERIALDKKRLGFEEKTEEDSVEIRKKEQDTQRALAEEMAAMANALTGMKDKGGSSTGKQVAHYMFYSGTVQYLSSLGGIHL